MIWRKNESTSYLLLFLPLCGNVQGTEFAIEYQNNLKIKSARFIAQVLAQKDRISVHIANDIPR
jgi:hypothetical protein